jgi:hypothetical protein
MSRFTRSRSARAQRGLSLVVALIMLTVMTMTLLMLFRMSNTGTQIVGNMQFRNEALAGANSAVQEVLSTVRMFTTPNLLFLQACDGSNNRRCYDLNGDGQNDLQVDVLPPACVGGNITPNASLDLADARQRECAIGESQNFGVEGVSGGNSLCADTLWEIRAQAGDFGGSGATGARMTVVQGVSVRVRAANAQTFCPGI